MKRITSLLVLQLLSVFLFAKSIDGYLLIPRWDSAESENDESTISKEQTSDFPSSSFAVVSSVGSTSSTNRKSTRELNLKSLENKLDLILDSERREKDIIENILLVSDSTSSTSSKSSNDDFKTNKISSRISERPTTMDSTTTTSPNSITQDLLSTNSNSNDLTQSMRFIAGKLSENSHRVESMVVFLADLKNVLSEAISVQEKQVEMKTEVSELRGEIDYLREEIRKLKSHEAEQRLRTNPTKFENKLHNGETTIEWLKGSIRELRHEMAEVSSSVNVTGLLSLQQEWQSGLQNLNRDLRGISKEIQGLQVSKERSDEAILEIKGDIAEIRNWQGNMGVKFTQPNPNHDPDSDPDPEVMVVGEPRVNSDYIQKQLDMMVQDSSAESEDDADDVDDDDDEEPQDDDNGDISRPKSRTRRRIRNHRRLRHRHQKLVRREFSALEKMIGQIGQDQRELHRRILKLEWKSWNQNHPANPLIVPGEMLSNNQNKNDRNGKVREYGASTLFRLSALEKTSADYESSLQALDDRINSLAHLKGSTTQIFKSLEALESKYDERLTTMQSAMAKMEATVSHVSVNDEEIKEQQIQQSHTIRNVQNEISTMKDHLQTNHLRLAAIQSHLVKEGLKICTSQNSESIQNIKIAALETQLGQNTDNELKWQN